MTTPPRTSVFSFFRQMRGSDVAAYVSVFLACFLSAKFGQYLFYTNSTSPAVIWPPFGIALGSILVGGYRMWFPIALAELFAASTSGVSPLPIELAATFGQTMQPLIGAWVMNYFGFNPRLPRLRDAFVLIGTAMTATMIAPSISTIVGFLMHALTASPSITWSRSWAGGILSVLVATPFITTWFPLRRMTYTRRQWTEIVIIFIFLITTAIFLFGTPYAQGYGLISIYALLLILMWIALRLKPRLVTLSFLILTVLGIAGTLIGHPTAVATNQQLFSDELFIEFLVVIFLIFATIVEERRGVRLALEKNVNELEDALKRISQEDRAKNEFIATLAHELRNPLAPVVSALELLKLQNPAPESIQTIEGAERELRTIRRLLDDLLDVARVSRPNFRLQREIIDMRELINRCIDSTKSFLAQRGHTLTVIVPQSEILIDVDPVRFQQIVVNLLNNAGKYTPPGGTIELTCGVNGADAFIRVSDNGVGIPSESLQDIFRPFWQIRPTPHVGTGLGIGLWLTKRLAEMHGGRIDVTSAGPDRGSSFTVSIPLPSKMALPSANQAPLWNATTTNSPKAHRILIVDDNEAAALGLKKLLEYRGHTVQVAHSGADAFTAAQNFSPRVILLDIGLPDMDGYQVARNIRALPLSVTLIALTGYGQEEDKRKATEAGFDYHLTKPIGIADLERVFEKLNS